MYLDHPTYCPDLWLCDFCKFELTFKKHCEFLNYVVDIQKYSDTTQKRRFSRTSILKFLVSCKACYDLAFKKCFNLFLSINIAWITLKNQKYIFIAL